MANLHPGFDPLIGRMQEILLRVTQLAPLEDVARRLADAARELTGADYAALGLYDAAGHLDHFITEGPPDLERDAGGPPSGRGLLGEFGRGAPTINAADVSAHAAFSGFPERHPEMGPFLGVPVVYGHRVLGAFYVTRRPGSPPFTTEDEAYLKGLAPYAAMAMSNAVVLDDERRRADLAAALAECAQTCHSSEDVFEIGAAMDATLDTLFPGSEHAVVQIDRAFDPPTHISPPGSALAAALGTIDLSAFAPGDACLTDVLPGRGVLLYTSGRDTTVQIALAVREGTALSAAESEALARLSEMGTAATAAVRRREAESMLERYAIRDAIARDLHDDLIQSIYAVGLGLRTTAEDPAVLREHLQTATHNLNEVIRDLRAYIAQLSRGTEALTTSGLLTARIEGLLRGQSLPLWEYSIDFGEQPIAATTERQLYLIIREAVSNVHRHAAATEASLSLGRRSDALHMEIRDNGIGFDRATVPPGAVGLRSLEERVADLGGSLMIESTPGAGTTLVATFPVDEPAERE
jgi:two-component system, NarL family, sensor histidine kinase DevS